MNVCFQWDVLKRGKIIGNTRSLYSPCLPPSWFVYPFPSSGNKGQGLKKIQSRTTAAKLHACREQAGVVQPLYTPYKPESPSLWTSHPHLIQWCALVLSTFKSTLGTFCLKVNRANKIDFNTKYCVMLTLKTKLTKKKKEMEFKWNWLEKQICFFSPHSSTNFSVHLLCMTTASQPQKHDVLIFICSFWSCGI